MIKGTIEGLGNGKVILINERSYAIDTVQAVNNSFIIEHEINIDDPKFHGIFLPHLSNKDGGLRDNKIFFFVDTDNIKITAVIIKENIENKNIEGSPITNEYHAIDAGLEAGLNLDKFYKADRKAFENYNEIEQSDENLKILEKSISIIDSLHAIKRQKMIAAITANSKSIALSSMVSTTFSSKPNSFLTDTILGKFSPEIKDLYYLKKLRTMVEKRKKVAIGSIAPDFSLPNELEENVTLSSLKGNYVLIDFWASWCGPCRREIPNMKKVHNLYKERGLKIVSVSTDATRRKWAKALDDEKLPYMKLWDEKSITRDLYQYNGIPHMVLLSPEGNIVQVNDGLRGEELEKTIASLYEK